MFNNSAVDQADQTEVVQLYLSTDKDLSLGQVGWVLERQICTEQNLFFIYLN
jgi:hypothetical protein